MTTIPARWYAVDKQGSATLCVDEQDAQEVAAEATQAYPQFAPYAAVQLAPASVTQGDAQDERQAFEAWMTSQGLSFLRDGDSYSLTYARRAWEAWQARGRIDAPAAGDALANFDIEAAAQKMAECMDYPWAHMPEQGRTHMRKYAQAVIDAALAAQRKGGA